MANYDENVQRQEDNKKLQQLLKSITPKIANDLLNGHAPELEAELKSTRYFDDYIKDKLMSIIMNADEDLQGMIRTRDGLSKSIEIFKKNVRANYDTTDKNNNNMSDAMSDQKARIDHVKEYIKKLTIQQINDILSKKVVDEELIKISKYYRQDYLRDYMISVVFKSDVILQDMKLKRDKLNEEMFNRKMMLTNSYK